MPPSLSEWSGTVRRVVMLFGSQLSRTDAMPMRMVSVGPVFAIRERPQAPPRAASARVGEDGKPCSSRLWAV